MSRGSKILEDVNPHKLDFEIELADSSVSIDEWRRAQKLPDSELPELTPEQKGAANKLGISEEAYARSVKAGEFGHERMHRRALEFGTVMLGILRDLKYPGTVDGVKADPFNNRWLIRLNSPAGILEFSRELVDDLLDSGRKSYLEQLRDATRRQLTTSGAKAKR
jgi:hypothetical protein